MEEHAQLAQRAEDLHAQHEDHEEGGQRHRAVADTPGADGERRRRADGDGGVGDAARQRVGAEHPHGGVEERLGLLLETARARRGLAEGLQRGQPLHGIEKLRAEGFVGLAAREAGPAVPAMPEAGRQQRGDGRRQHHQRHRQVEEGDEREDQQRRQRRHEELRQVLAEVDLELLDPLDHREHDVARAVAHEVRGAERGHLGVEPPPQLALHAGRRVVGGHGPRVVERAAADERQRGEDDRGRERRQRVAGEHAGQQPAEQREAGDAGDGGHQPDQHGGGDAAADAGGQRPQSPIEIHGSASGRRRAR